MKNLPQKAKSNTLDPLYEREQHPCPFYGMAMGEGYFLDTNGNQCALISGRHSPCKMELDGEKPNWYNCSHNNSEIILDLMNRNPPIKIFPDELKKGINFKEWYEYVMGKSLGENL